MFHLQKATIDLPLLVIQKVNNFLHSYCEYGQRPQGALPKDPRHWTEMQTHHYVVYRILYQTQLQEVLFASHF